MYNEAQIGARLARIFPLMGKVAVITGAAQGLGRQAASLLAELGVKIVIADLNFGGAKTAATEIEALGGTAVGLHLDLADEDSIKRLFSSVDEIYGGVDILVNSAADRSKAEMFEMSVAQWDRMFAISMRGTFLASREAILRMKAKGDGGSIVNISSVGSVRTTLWGVNVHYDAAKAGVDSLTRSLASEFAADNIRVNSVMPGGMASEGGGKISASYHIRGPIMGPNRILMGRMGTTLEVAQTVMFLASPASSYVTGQIIAVDGGYMVS